MDEQNIYFNKIFSKLISSKELISRIYDEILQFSNKRQSTQMKMGKLLEQYFTKEDVQMPIITLKDAQYY